MIELTLEGAIVIAASVAGFVVLSALLWWLIPRYVSRFFRLLDSIVVLDVVGYSRPVARGLFVIVFGMMLAALIFTVLTQTGIETDGVQAAARSDGSAVGRWLGPKALRVLLIVGLTLLALRLIHNLAPKLVRLFLKGRTESEAARLEVDKRAKTLDGVVNGTLSVFIILIALFTILSEFGVSVGPVLAGVGIAGISIGFGAQGLVRDVISGVFILLEDHYRVGDVVRIAGTAGLVEDINLRRTVLRDLDFIQHFIPNGEITIASNFTKEKSRVNLNIPVAYRSDLDHVIAVLNRVGEEMSQDEVFGPLITDQIKVLRVDSFDDSGISIKVLGETLPLRQWDVAGEYRKRLKKAFDQEGIEIPFPHRTLYWGNNVETKVRQLVEDSAVQQARASHKNEAN
ncbi:MAG: mechanosensitive ion channel family protein [Chloroflexi bacterium]|nr:mechanosensitive ion channel family protein [Chloroflexota bacterium]